MQERDNYGQQLKECFTVHKRRIKNSKFIVDGKLYDTKKSKILCCTEDDRILFVTPKGNYFTCKSVDSEYSEIENGTIQHIFEVNYYGIRIETEDYVKYNLGIYDYEMYIELFGAVEEA